ncbi:MAG: hypothetical protein WCP35_14310, partial [Verrucomicrobiota bacterium]
AAIPGLIVGHIYRLQWITCSPRGGNISVEGSDSKPLTGTSDAATVLSITWQATDTTANILVTRQNTPHYGGKYDSEMLFNGYALHDMGASDPFAAWIGSNYPALTGSKVLPGSDPDGDGMSNQAEFAFGLDPTSSASCNPIKVPFDKATGMFSYTRRATPAITGLAYTVWTSADLKTWTEDTAASASQTVSATNGDVQTVSVHVTTAPSGGKLLVRVQAQ